MIRQIAISAAAALRLAMLDRDAVNYFENDESAFWRSFVAAVVAAPNYVLLALYDAPGETDGRFIAVKTISYVIGWVIFPLVMLAYTEAAGCADRYFRFIAAWNWGIFIQLLLFLAVQTATLRLPDNVNFFLWLFATVAAFLYQAFIAHVALEVRATHATAIMLIGNALSLCLHGIGYWMLQG